ncbi:MAG TPA: response regulator transcription factor [Jiangellales bacterium]|nr:response regulator transcription factor [Jiangellales bacterium]
MTSILVVEDDRLIASFLERGLRSSGFSTALAGDGESAQRLATTESFDLVVLDMGLPDGDGLTLLRRLRTQGLTAPILVLTGLAERDVVTCLENGADDYMRKPFHFEELLARIRTRLRTTGTQEPFQLTAGRLRLDLRTRRAEVGDRVVELTGREFSLLETFLRHPDQVLSREQLLSQVWGYSFDPGTNLVNVYVNTLRKKLGADVVETVRGAGYRLRAS